MQNNHFSFFEHKEAKKGEVINKIVELDKMTIQALQLTIHRHVQRLGGYWRPLSALARIIEEYGELAELIEKSSDHEQLGSELADLFIITTCLANQYSCQLATEYKKLDLPLYLTKKNLLVYQSVIGSSYLTMATLIGELARVVNSYEGDKKPKKGAKLPTIQELTGKLHSVIFSFACQHNIELIDYIQKCLHVSAARDQNRFDNLYDPTMCASLEEFAKVEQYIECPFAKSAKIWGNPSWQLSKTVEENVANLLPTLNRFIKIGLFENLDGFVIAAPQSYGEKINMLANFTRQVLQILSDMDPAREHCMNKKIDEPDWQFSYAGQRFFITTFASCYAKNNSRYNYEIENTFIFLQPEFSFAQQNIARGEELGKTREHIRQRFSKQGKDYYRTDIMETNLEALRYVKPLTVNDPPIRWWESCLLQEDQNEEYGHNCVII